MASQFVKIDKIYINICWTAFDRNFARVCAKFQKYIRYICNIQICKVEFYGVMLF